MTRPHRLSCHPRLRRNKMNLPSRDRPQSPVQLMFHRLPQDQTLFGSFQTLSSLSTQIAETKLGKTRHHPIRRRVIRLQSVVEAVPLPPSELWAYPSHIQHRSNRKTVHPRGKNHQRHHLGKRWLLSRPRLRYRPVISLNSYQGTLTVTLKGHRHLGLYGNRWVRIRGEYLRPNSPGAKIANPRESGPRRAQSPRHERGSGLIADLRHGGRVHAGFSKVGNGWRKGEVRTIGDGVGQVVIWRDSWSRWRRRCDLRYPILAACLWEVCYATLVFVYRSPLCGCTLHLPAVTRRQRRLVMIITFILNATTLMEGRHGATRRRSWIGHSACLPQLFGGTRPRNATAGLEGCS